MNDRSIAVKGGIWTGMSTIVTMSTQILRLVILTRFLEKSDFGLVSITNMVIGLCITFTDLGFASVIMYKKELSKEEFSSLYWIQFFIFLIIYFFVFIIAKPISSFYQEPLLAALIPISALSVIGQAVGKLYDSVLLKKYLFKSLTFRNIISNVTSLVLAWLLASRGYGVYSLVYSTLYQIVFFNTWNLISGYKIQRLGFVLRFKSVVPLIKMGLYQTGTHIFDYLSGKLDVIIMGKLLGTELLGVYDLAKELVFKFVSLIRTIVSRVALPILTNNNSDDEAVKKRFLSITRVVAYICIPVCISVSIFSEPIVKILYGEKYLDAIPVVAIFSIISMFSSIASFFDMLGVAKGRTDLNFKQTINRIIVTTPIILITSYIGLMAVVWGLVLITIISLTLFWRTVLMNTYPMPFKLYFTQFSKYLIVFVIVGIIMGLLMWVNPISFIDNWYVRQSIYIIIYIVIVVLSGYKYLSDEYNYIKSFVGKS